MQGPIATSTLSRVRVFANLPEKTLQNIATRLTTQRFEPGEVVIEHLDTSRDMYVILSGSVRVSMVATTGRPLTYEILEIGEMFGEVAALDGEPRTAAVLAESDAVIGRLTLTAVQELVAESSEFAMAILYRLAKMNRRLAHRLYEYHAYDVKGRVYAELLRQSAHSPSESISLTDRDMASRVGTTRENVSRIHADLRRQGVIERAQMTLTVINRPQLEAMLKDCEFS